MKRRKFFTWIGVGAAVTYLLAQKNSSQPAVAGDAPALTKQNRSDGFVPVGSLKQLDREGQLLNKKAALGPALVIRDPANAKKVVAVNPTCTHAGCTVAWKKEGNFFTCPCHGSKFSSNGQVKGGPARSPLKTYATKIEGDTILVKKV